MQAFGAAAAALLLVVALARPLDAVALAPAAQSMKWTSLSRAQWVGRKGHCALVHRGYAFVIAGGSKDQVLNDVWSADEDDLSVGTQRWTRQSSAAFRTARQSGACVHFQHRMYYLGGQQEESPTYLDEVYVSDNGKRWTLTDAPGWSGRAELAATAVNGTMWIYGGTTGSSSYLNDIWRTRDGVHWTEVSPYPSALPRRAGAQAAAISGHLFLFGGRGTDAPDGSNTISYTRDGTAWTTVPSEQPPPWARRDSFGVLAYGDSLYLMGGSPPDQTTASVYASSDGVDWSLVAPSPGWAASGGAGVGRSGFALVALSNKMLLLGGERGHTYFQDVWVYDACKSTSCPDRRVCVQGTCPCEQGYYGANCTQHAGSNPTPSSGLTPWEEARVWVWIITGSVAGLTALCCACIACKQGILCNKGSKRGGGERGTGRRSRHPSPPRLGATGTHPFAASTSALSGDREAGAALASPLLAGASESGAGAAVTPAADDEVTRVLLQTRSQMLIPVEELELDDTPIAAGGFGVVYRGMWGDMEVGVKVLHHHLVTDANRARVYLRRFEEEADLMSRLQHPHVSQLLGVCMQPTLCLVTEFARYGSLSDLLLRTDLQVPLDALLTMAQQIVDAMACLHEHEPPILHRDLNGNNVLVYACEPEHIDVRIADFGLAKQMVRDATQPHTAFVGSPAFIPPEVLRDDARYNTKADVYSFGVTLWTVVQYLYANELEEGQDPTARAQLLQPYPGLQPWQIVTRVRDGMRPSIPPTCPKFVEEVMLLCWSRRARRRPSFARLRRMIAGWPEKARQWSVDGIYVPDAAVVYSSDATSDASRATSAAGKSDY